MVVIVKNEEGARQSNVVLRKDGLCLAQTLSRHEHDTLNYLIQLAYEKLTVAHTPAQIRKGFRVLDSQRHA